MSEANAAVELGVSGEPFLDAGHADEDDAHPVAVVKVADLFEASGFESVGFVDDEQFGVPTVLRLHVHERINVPVLGIVDGPGDLLACPGQALIDLLDGRGDGGREERRATSLHRFGHRWQCAFAAGKRVPLLPLVSACVVAGGACLPNAGRSVAEADVAV